MRRLILVSTLLALALVPLAAQSTSGWKVRADRSTSASDPDGAGEIKFTARGKGFHAVNPAAAVYWHPSNTATGNYTLKGTFTLNKPSGHNNYYGLVFGGSGLEGADQSYLYFLVAQDGTFLVKRRMGDAKTDNVVAKTANAAIKKPDASGQSTNTLEVHVMADKVDLVVNGTSVHSMPKADLKTDGIWGVRVNHLLDVNIDDIAVTK
ncbi:MAG: hypothetical protein IT180_11645 [Acidobacteria bacterium]|nr:hypothetical protein [Acidobacteriota bacterium]HQZ37693.1 hypothetical protein [Vicinamibacterales bacterium]